MADATNPTNTTTSTPDPSAQAVLLRALAAGRNARRKLRRTAVGRFHYCGKLP